MCGVARRRVCANTFLRKHQWLEYFFSSSFSSFSKFWPTAFIWTALPVENTFLLWNYRVSLIPFSFCFYFFSRLYILALFYSLERQYFFYFFPAFSFLHSLLLIPCPALRLSHYFSSLDSLLCLSWATYGRVRRLSGPHRQPLVLILSWLHLTSVYTATLGLWCKTTTQKNPTDFHSCLPSTPTPPSPLPSCPSLSNPANQVDKHTR